MTCTVKNTGKRAGSEVVQCICRLQGVGHHPPRAGTAQASRRSAWSPGRAGRRPFTPGRRAFAYYNTSLSDWHVESGEYEVRVGASSRDVRLKGTGSRAEHVAAPLPDLRKTAPCYYDLSRGIRVSDKPSSACSVAPSRRASREQGSPHSIQSTLAEIQDTAVGRLLMSTMRRKMKKVAGENADLRLMIERMVPDMTLRFLGMMSSGAFPLKTINALVEMMNGHTLPRDRQAVEQGEIGVICWGLRLPAQSSCLRPACAVLCYNCNTYKFGGSVTEDDCHHCAPGSAR